MMDPFMMIFTSGTSGNPKAVQVSHLMPTFAGRSLTERFGLSAHDTRYVSMPLFHSNAVVAGWAPAVVSGAAIAPAKFSATGFLDDIRRYQATYMNYVGKPLAYILATPERDDDAENPLRVAFGNEANEKDIEEFSRRFAVQVEDGFGSTENAVIVIREPGTPPGSIGKGVDGVAVYNSDSVTECAVARFDEYGALANADEAVGRWSTPWDRAFHRLLQRSRRQRRAYAPWHVLVRRPRLPRLTGLDLSRRPHRRLDAGRRRNLAAALIERILLRHNAVNRVAVYAVPDARVGDQVMAAFVPHRDQQFTPNRLKRFCARNPTCPPKPGRDTSGSPQICPAPPPTRCSSDS